MTSGNFYNAVEIRRAPRKLKPGARILMTVDAAGGVWDYALQLAQALAPHGIEIVLASMGVLPGAAQRAGLRNLPNVVLCESDYKLEWMNDPWRDVDDAAAWLLQLESYVRPAIIHLNGYCHANLAWTAPSLVVGHSCVYSWFAAVKRQAPGCEWEEYRRRVVAGLRAATLVTAPSETMLAALRYHYGCFRSGGAVYNGRAELDFRPGEKQPIILTAGRLWDEAKNIGSLAQLSRTLPWPVYAAGECASPDQKISRFEGLNLLGPLSRSELAGWLSRAAIFALPARYEPFGLAALEAALAGCVLVLGDIPSLREIWRDAAVFVSPDRRDTLLDALERLIQEPSFRSVMARRARKRALTFSVERMGRGYMDLYRRILESGKAHSARRMAQSA
ncbi:MAG TPA: glycosyltransferase family 4 protein [Candidatus Binatia bacterium]|nr:glycosyltransferase family 4 protein [Candidatus Binatia bacterium]